MKKFVLSFFFCLLFIIESLNAQYATRVTIIDIGNVALTKKMEQEASKFLTACNAAFTQNTAPSIDFIEDKQSVFTIWAMSPFKCVEIEIIERGYTTRTGYQIRNIPIFLKDVPEEDTVRDIAINFDRDGNIYDISFTISNGIIRPAKDVTEMRRIGLLNSFIEDYLMAYYRKDISFISKVLTDDVIVTGREIKSVKSPENSRPLPDTTREYLAVLQRIFAKNERIDFNLNEIMLQQHSKYDHIYGLTFVQILHLTHYRDMSYVFLYIDFQNENEPLIKVRIFKPYEYGKEKYDLDDFM